MKIRIIDTNKGQVPSTIKGALYISGLTRYQLKKDIEYTNYNTYYPGTHFNAISGYHFGIEVFN
jgi:hypothetical protein